jgi:hypothetical protein
VTHADRPVIPPKGIDLDHPSVARVYDYILGGQANWAVDQIMGEQLLQQLPVIRDMAIANRQFLNRAVTYLCRQGIRQFLDVGAGVPTVGNTHQAAERVAPGRTRVVYVDNDAVAVAHAKALLGTEGDPHRHGVIDADLRNPDEVWDKAVATGLLDPTEPVALLIIAVLHIAQPGPDGTDLGSASVARLRELIPSGSYLAISHATRDGVPSHPTSDRATALYTHSVNDLVLRSRDEIQALLGGFPLVEPGMAWTNFWHREIDTPLRSGSAAVEEAGGSAGWAGIGKKP